MKDISILFNFNESDFASYNINIGEQTYQVNHDSSSINLCVNNHSSINLSYKPERLTVNKIILTFMLLIIAFTVQYKRVRKQMDKVEQDRAEDGARNTE